MPKFRSESESEQEEVGERLNAKKQYVDSRIASDWGLSK